MITDQFIDKLAYIYVEGKAILMIRSKWDDVYYIPVSTKEGHESALEALTT